MDINELLRMLVEEPDQMARMTLVEENQDVIAGVGAAEGGEDYKQKYDDLVKKYTETFFSQGKTEEKDQNEDSEDEEPKSLDELGF